MELPTTFLNFESIQEIIDSTVHWFLNWFDTILILIFDISFMFNKVL